MKTCNLGPQLIFRFLSPTALDGADEFNFEKKKIVWGKNCRGKIVLGMHKSQDVFLLDVDNCLISIKFVIIRIQMSTCFSC